MWSKILLLFLLIWNCPSVVAQDDHVKTIHIIPHSHCDPGWLETFEGYYNNQVRKILNNVLYHLKQNPHATFVWAEISFFDLWWKTQDQETKEEIRKFVREGRLEFVGGGWVQNDEAAASIDQVVDQIAEGHKYLYQEFGVVPRFAWQIDPFGHSSATPALFSQMGYEALVINRIHFNLKNRYKASKDMEFIWRPNPTQYGDSLDMFTHVLHTHYSAPKGFDWEERSPSITDGNIKARTKEFLQVIDSRLSSYRTSNLLVPWGDDFKFQNSKLQFDNMDKLMNYINENHGDSYKIQYSTLSQYFDAVNAEVAQSSDIGFSTYENDFFPYADNADSYWTGYYTSRYRLKKKIRDVNSLTKAADTLTSLALVETQQAQLLNWSAIDEKLTWIRQTNGLLQHHDAVTGTARALVVEDYSNKLTQAGQFANTILSATASLMLSSQTTSSDEVYASLADDYVFTTPGDYLLTAFNPTPCPRTERVSFKSSLPRAEVMEAFTIPMRVGDFNNFFTYLTIPAFGFTTTQVRLSSESQLQELESINEFSADELQQPQSFTLYNSDQSQIYEIDISSEGIHSIVDLTTEKKYDFSISYAVYSHTGGAYIMKHPKDKYTVTETKRLLKVVAYPQGSQIVLHYDSVEGSEVTQSIVVSEGSPFLKIDHSISATQPDRELVVRYHSSTDSSNVLYTFDGLRFNPRTVQHENERPHPNSFFPSNGISFIEDDQTQLTVLTDFSEGISSHQSGSLEAMLIRRASKDDGRGMAQAMNDADHLSATHHVFLGEKAASKREMYKAHIMSENPVRFLYANKTSSRDLPFSLSPLKENQDFCAHDIEVLSVQVRPNERRSTLGLRLLSHSNGPQTLDINDLFSSYLVEEQSETIPSFLKPSSSLKRVTYPPSGHELSSCFSCPFESTTGGDSQNTNETGVFLSDAALRKKQEDSQDKQKDSLNLNLGKKTLSIPTTVSLLPLQISTHELELSLNGEIDKMRMINKFPNLEQPNSPPGPIKKVEPKPPAKPPRKPNRPTQPKVVTHTPPSQQQTAQETRNQQQTRVETTKQPEGTSNFFWEGTPPTPKTKKGTSFSTIFMLWCIFCVGIALFARLSKKFKAQNILPCVVVAKNQPKRSTKDK